MWTLIFLLHTQTANFTVKHIDGWQSQENCTLAGAAVLRVSPGYDAIRFVCVKK